MAQERQGKESRRPTTQLHRRRDIGRKRITSTQAKVNAGDECHQCCSAVKHEAQRVLYRYLFDKHR